MTKAVTKAQEAAVPAVQGQSALPAHLQQFAGTGSSGLQGLDVSDFIVPRIKLLQATSEEPKAFDDAKSGEFWVNVLDIPLGKTFQFIPISNRKRYLLSVPLGGTPTGILARADDGVHWSPPKGEWEVKLKGRRNSVTWKIEGDGTVRGSGLAEFGTADPDDPDSNPAATLFYDYLVSLPAHPEIGPVLLSLARTQAKRARELNMKIEAAKVPMQGLLFQAKTTDETSAEGGYYNVTFQRDGFASEEQFNEARAYADRFKEYRGADEDGEVAEAAGGSKSNAGKDEKDF